MDERAGVVRTVPIRHVADVWTSSVDKHTVEGEPSVQLCNYTDAYKKDKVRPGPDLMRATASLEEIRRNRLQVGDSVFTKDSEDPRDIGISAFVDADAPDFVCGYHLAIARPSERIHPRYLNWALRSQPVLDHFGNHAAGISRYGIGTAGLRSAPIPELKLDEQRRIADFLDDRVSRIDRIISARRAQTRLAQELRKGVVSRAISVGGTGTRMRYLCRPVDLRSGGSSMPLLSVSIHRGVGRREELADTPGRADDLTNYKVVAAEDIVLNRMRAFQGAVGVAREGGLVSPDYLVLRAGPSVLPGWLDLLFRSAWFVSEMTSRIRGIGSVDLGTVRTPRINWSDLAEIKVEVPSIAAQSSAVEQVGEVEAGSHSVAAELRCSIDLLSEYKSSLITAAVTGELDVTTAGSNIPG